MCGILKTGVRAALLLAVVGGVAVAIAGPERIHAAINQARSNIHGAIDRTIDDPVALRAQLRNLEGQYPERIAEVRGDLAEITQQVQLLERELQVSKKAVSLADADLEKMRDVLARAEDARTENAAAIVRVRLDDRAMSMDEAYAQANRVSQVRSAYSTRAADIERDLGYLTQQESRLTDLLAQLETERAEFQAQLWQLDRQVDAIARNERMIELMEKRQDRIEEHSRYRVASLEQLNTRFADIRGKQEAKLQMLTQSSEVKNYENAAKFLLDNQQSRSGAAFGPAKGSTIQTIEVAPPVIEVGPEQGGTPAGPIARTGR